MIDSSGGLLSGCHVVGQGVSVHVVHHTLIHSRSHLSPLPIILQVNHREMVVKEVTFWWWADCGFHWLDDVQMVTYLLMLLMRLSVRNDSVLSCWRWALATWRHWMTTCDVYRMTMMNWADSYEHCRLSWRRPSSNILTGALTHTHTHTHSKHLVVCLLRELFRWALKCQSVLLRMWAATTLY